MLLEGFLYARGLYLNTEILHGQSPRRLHIGGRPVFGSGRKERLQCSRTSNSELKQESFVQTGIFFAAATFALACTPAVTVSAQARSPAVNIPDVSDAALVRSLPGFTSRFATVGGIRLHYVVGGEGSPVMLLSRLARDLVGVSQDHAGAGQNAPRDLGGLERHGKLRQTPWRL